MTIHKNIKMTELGDIVLIPDISVSYQYQHQDCEHRQDPKHVRHQ